MVWKKEIPITDIDKHICEKIVAYLLGRQDHQDSLDGILLGVYEMELERLNNRILAGLQYLVSAGILEKRQLASSQAFGLIVESESLNNFLDDIKDWTD